MSIKLQVKPSPTESFEWQHAGPEFHIGRQASCALRFVGEAAQLVSGLHVLVQLSASGAFLTDMNSTNGTFVNGARVTQRARLRVGDEIHLGKGGPRLGVLAIGSAVAPLDPAAPVAPGAAASPWSQTPVTAAPQSGVANGSSPAASASALGPTKPSATRRMLVDMQRQNRKTLLVLGGIGIAVLLVVVAALIMSSGDAGNEPASLANEARDEKPADRRHSVHGVHSSDDRNDTHNGGDESSRSGGASMKPAPQPTFTPQEISQRWRDNVFWVGFRKDTTVIPVCTAWALEPTLLATAANNVDALEYARQEGLALVASVDAAGSNLVDIVNTRTHPRFDRNDTASDVSVSFNVGVLTLAHPLPRTSETTIDDANAPSAGSIVTIPGFSVPFDDDALAAIAAGRCPQYHLTTARAFGGGSGERYSLIVETAIPRGMNGAPVISDEGKVVGVLCEYSNKLYAVSAIHLKTLMQ